MEFRGTEMGGKGGNGSERSGSTLCQHVPETAATQSCPAGCQARVSRVVPSPVLHHVHCVFGCFPIHRPRRGPSLPAILWLPRVPLIRRLSWAGIRTSGTHRAGGVAGVSRIRLLHVHRVSLRWVALWRRALGWIAWSSGATTWVWRGLLEIHLWVEQSPLNEHWSPLYRQQQHGQEQTSSVP